MFGIVDLQNSRPEWNSYCSKIYF